MEGYIYGLSYNLNAEGLLHFKVLIPTHKANAQI